MRQNLNDAAIALSLKLFIRFLLSISVSGDSAFDFLDMKTLIGCVTYLKQHL